MDPILGLTLGASLLNKLLLPGPQKPDKAALTYSDQDIAKMMQEMNQMSARRAAPMLSRIMSIGAATRTPTSAILQQLRGAESDRRQDMLEQMPKLREMQRQSQEGYDNAMNQYNTARASQFNMTPEIGQFGSMMALQNAGMLSPPQEPLSGLFQTQQQSRPAQGLGVQRSNPFFRRFAMNNFRY